MPRQDIQNILEYVKEKLVAVYQPQVIYLFGSYAWGTPTKDSDLDLLVVTNKLIEKKVHERIALGRRALVDLPIPKDLIVYTEAEFSSLVTEKSSLCFKIKNKGIKIYKESPFIKYCWGILIKPFLIIKLGTQLFDAALFL